jgi:hypothetical protein
MPKLGMSRILPLYCAIHLHGMWSGIKITLPLLMPLVIFVDLMTKYLVLHPTSKHLPTSPEKICAVHLLYNSHERRVLLEFPTGMWVLEGKSVNFLMNDVMAYFSD